MNVHECAGVIGASECGGSCSAIVRIVRSTMGENDIEVSRLPVEVTRANKNE